MADTLPDQEIERARAKVSLQYESRATEIRELATKWAKQDSWLLCVQWQTILQMVARAVEELAEGTLMLCADYSDSEFIDEGRRLSALTYGMFVDLWGRVKGNKKLERDHRGFSAEQHAEAAGMEVTRKVEFIAEQMVLNGRRPSLRQRVRGQPAGPKSSGQEIERLRIKLHWTQAGTARAAGVSLRSVIRAEKDEASEQTADSILKTLREEMARQSK